jgi:hypothetical protein
MKCQWKDSYNICKCGYSEFIGLEVDEECESCIDNTENERIEDNETGELL